MGNEKLPVNNVTIINVKVKTVNKFEKKVSHATGVKERRIEIGSRMK